MFTRTCILLFVIALLHPVELAFVQNQPADPRAYEIGMPVFTDLWVDPVSGDDTSSGSSAADALRTLDAAWRTLPQGETLTAGVRILLLPGVYTAEMLPGYWEARYGSFDAPIVIQAARGAGTVILPAMNVYDVRYLYLLDLTLESADENVFHCERCDHVLLRGMTLTGTNPDGVHETIKVNQSQYFYIENSDISGTYENAIDFVAVQYGHVLGSRIHNAADSCIYVKGGSADLLIEANEIYDCGNAGFLAGQGTGFQYMVPPWLHYEAYAIRFVNNIVHDTFGAGAGVQGGYNILLAHNTFYRVGERSHLLEVWFGLRSCDGQPGDDGRERCAQYLDMGGWGTTAVDDGDNFVRIPNRHVYILNNVFYNPPGYQSAWQHFWIPGPYDGAAQDGANVPNPARADDDLYIAGNLFWNGDTTMPLGIEASSEGCQTDNRTCNADQLRADNAINTVEARFVDAEHGDFHFAPDFDPVSIYCNLPDFTWQDAPAGVPAPLEPLRLPALDYAGAVRGCPAAVGAYAG